MQFPEETGKQRGYNMYFKKVNIDVKNVHKEERHSERLILIIPIHSLIYYSIHLVNVY
jgi:hypothetical protein